MAWIFDIIGNEFNIHQERQKQPFKTVSLFTKSRIRKDLDVVQKIIVFRFMVNLNNAIEIEPIEPLLF
jgi:hypothetical protein